MVTERMRKALQEGRSLPQFAALEALRASPGPMSRQELADALGVAEKTAARNLESLFAEGLLERSNVPKRGGWGSLHGVRYWLKNGLG